MKCKPVRRKEITKFCCLHSPRIATWHRSQFQLQKDDIIVARADSPCKMSVQYTGGGGGGEVVEQYNRGCSVHQGDIMSTVRDIMSTLGDIMSTPGEYYDKCGGTSLGKQLNLYGNPRVLNIPWCTHDIHHTHHGIPQCTHGIPQ